MYTFPGFSLIFFDRDGIYGGQVSNGGLLELLVTIDLMLLTTMVHLVDYPLMATSQNVKCHHYFGNSKRVNE